MARLFVQEAEALLDHEFKVLNKGFVRLVDYMGGDQRIIQAARVSYGEGTKSYREDKGLINYLMRNWHTSPFEQVQLTFHTKMPILVARQWVRHRTARLNEISGRYSIMKDEFYVPDPDQICTQSADNKQGSGECLPLDQAMEVIRLMEEEHKTQYAAYQNLIDMGVAREMARSNLPLSLYTEWYWQIDLHNLFHFLMLRMDSHAQYQIRVYADAMAECAKAVAPLAYEAFENHVLNAVRFSVDEFSALKQLMNGGQHELKGRAASVFDAKITKIGSFLARTSETVEA